MADDIDEEVSAKEAKQTPSSLPAYLKGSAGANRYVAAIGDEAKIPDENERVAALEMVGSDPKLFPRAVELMRAVSASNNSRLRAAIKLWASDILRACDPALSRWAQLADRRPEDEVGDLARRLRLVRSSADKAKVTEAEQVLLMGIAIASTRADFDAIGTLSSIHSTLGRDETAEETRQRVTKAIANASLKQLNIYSSVNQVVSAHLQKLGDQFASARQERDIAREKVRDLQERVVLLSAEIEGLKADKALAADEANALSIQLEGTKGGAAHDMIGVRARFRRLLTGKISPFVSDAMLALQVNPPVVNVAKERLDQIKSEVDKELEWLKQFSD